jgi:hypothetical protein
MLNIISNNCVGGFITRDILHTEYKNPFIWTTTEALDMISLMSNFMTINWANFSLEMDDNCTMFGIIDNKVKTRFTHYKLNPNAHNIVIGGPANNDIYSDKIWEYICLKYISRVKRLCTCGITPIFICCGANNRPRYDFGKDFTLDEQEQLYHIATANKVRLIISFKNNINLPNTEYVTVVEQTQSFLHDGIDFAKYLWNNAVQEVYRMQTNCIQ